MLGWFKTPRSGAEEESEKQADGESGGHARRRFLRGVMVSTLVAIPAIRQLISPAAAHAAYCSPVVHCQDGHRYVILILTWEDALGRHWCTFEARCSNCGGYCYRWDERCD